MQSPVTRTQRRRCARARARAFSRAPRALVRTSPHLHATVRAFSSRFSRSRRPPTRRRWRVQERGSQGFANRAEAHVDRRRDEVRPAPARGFIVHTARASGRGVIFGDRRRHLLSRRRSTRDRARVFPRGPPSFGLPHATRRVSAVANVAHVCRRRDAPARTARRVTRGNTPLTPHRRIRAFVGRRRRSPAPPTPRPRRHVASSPENRSTRRSHVVFR